MNGPLHSPRSTTTLMLSLTGRSGKEARALIARLLRAAHQDKENRGVSVYADLDPYQN